MLCEKGRQDHIYEVMGKGAKCLHVPISEKPFESEPQKLNELEHEEMTH